MKGLGELFEGYSAETCAGKISLVPMGVQAEGPACADPGARPPSALAEFGKFFHILFLLLPSLLLPQKGLS